MFGVSAKQVEDRLVIRWQFSKIEIPLHRSHLLRWTIHTEAVNLRQFGSGLLTARPNGF